LESSGQTRGGCGDEDRAARIFPGEIIEHEKEKGGKVGFSSRNRLGVFFAVDRLQASEVRLLTGKAEEASSKETEKRIQNWRGPPPP
jgi:hypothetical protein